MKHLMLLPLIGLLISCQTEAHAPEIIGHWNWVKTQGGFGGISIWAKRPDEKTLVFGRDGIMKILENGKVKQSVEFTLGNEKSITSTRPLPTIKFADQASINLSYQIKKDSLFLTEEVYDGFTHTYVR
jgi:hypothetical protein